MKRFIFPFLLLLSGCMMAKVAVKTSDTTGWSVGAISFFHDVAFGPVYAQYGSNLTTIALNDYLGSTSTNGAPYVAAFGDLLGNLAQAAMAFKDSPTSSTFNVSIERR